LALTEEGWPRLLLQLVGISDLDLLPDVVVDAETGAVVFSIWSGEQYS
jgi:hypothetical protein